MMYIDILRVFSRALRSHSLNLKHLAKLRLRKSKQYMIMDKYIFLTKVHTLKKLSEISSVYKA